jgi:uncharacterized protein (TIGR02679 family)
MTVGGAHDVAADAEVAGPDPVRLSRTLGDPALARVVRRLVRRLELGRPLEAGLTLRDASEAERLAVSRLLGRRVSLRGGSLLIAPAQLSAALSRAGIAPDLRSAVEALTGQVTSRAEVAAAESAGRAAALDTLAAGRHAGTSWYEQWAEALQADGTLTRLVRARSVPLIEQAVAVLDELPADLLPLPALAERATGDTKALSGTRLARLVLRALALREGRGARVLSATALSAAGEGTAAGLRVLSRAGVQRALWESAGAIPDDMASQALVLGMTAVRSGPLARWLSEAAETGTPFRVTLQQLVSMPLQPTVARVFVCENPSVLRAAAAAGAGSGRPASGPALVCTEGVASAACHRLLAAVAGTGARIHWRGDFDWTGLRAVGDAVARYGARPWRMGLADYDAALAAGAAEPLRGPAAASPWDPPLAERMAQIGSSVMEERLIPLLVADLAEAVTGASSHDG